MGLHQTCVEGRLAPKNIISAHIAVPIKGGDQSERLAQLCWGICSGQTCVSNLKEKQYEFGTGMHGHSNQGTSGMDIHGAVGSRKLHVKRDSEEAPGSVPARR